MRPRREPRRRGASAVEMAVIAPVFLTLVLGIIESSRLGMVSQLLTTAVREGCRVAVINGMTETMCRTGSTSPSTARGSRGIR